MISIERATLKDYQAIVDIGLVTVEEAHRDSTSAENLAVYLSKNYNEEAIRTELLDSENVYHLIYHDDKAVGFSKIVLDAAHEKISSPHVTKLDRIYVLKEYQGLKLGKQLMDFNIEFAKQQGQAGIWLYTWIGNEKAIHFYVKAGFKNIGSHKFYVTDDYFNLNHHMFLRIKNVEL